MLDCFVDATLIIYFHAAYAYASYRESSMLLIFSCLRRARREVVECHVCEAMRSEIEMMRR